jgi:signal transduction histidine kinase
MGAGYDEVVDASLLVNTLGHLAGVVLFGIFLALLWRDRAGARARGWKPVWAAALALVWNLASLVVLGMGGGEGWPARLAMAVGFSVLSLLPAVLFDLCLDGRDAGLVRAGYALASVSVAPHLVELARTSAELHRTALVILSLGFGVLTAVAAFLHRAHTPRLIGTMSLFLLAVSFVHLGEGHAEQIWSQELIFHHAAIPLALLVLLQDDRFLLLDAFLRFLANVLLAAGFVAAAAVVWRWAPPAESPFGLALVLAAASLLLILFAVARAGLQRWLTRALFRRPDERALLERLRAPVREEPAYLEECARRLGEYLEAEVELRDEPGEVSIPVRGAGEPRHMVFGRRAGGRRYLSEDLELLQRAGALIREQLEAHREEELRRLVSQAELRALQSQIHPHFLFNALNALYGVIPREARGARETVLNLADIFRYFLDTRRTLAPLAEELRIVRAYLDIERLRLGEKLRVAIDAEPAAMEAPVPVLCIQPLVENAVQHGIAPLSAGGQITLEARREPGGGLYIAVSDTGRGFPGGAQAGVGLENVRRRLELCYGDSAHLDIYSGPQGSTVCLLLPATAAVGAAR